MRGWGALRRFGWRRRRNVESGRLKLIPVVVMLALFHLVAVGKYLWFADAVLRPRLLHPVDVLLKFSIGLSIILALWIVWVRSKPARQTIGVFDWVGGGLLSLAFTLIFATPDEIFRIEGRGPFGEFLTSYAWAVWGLIGVVLLVTATAKLSHEMNSEQAERERLETMIEFTKSITTLDYQIILDEAVKHLHRLLRAEACVLYLWNEEEQVLVPVAGVHDPAVYAPAYVSRMMSFKCPLGFGLTGWVMQTGEPYIAADVMRDSRSQGVPGYKLEAKSCLLAPIQVEGRRLGVVRLTRRGLYQFTDEDMDLTLSFAGQAALVIEHGRTVKELGELSITDSLTGLYNSRHFQQVLSVELSRAERHHLPLSLVMVDSDSLKKLNDLLGHQRGDEYIRTIGRVIQENIRLSDYAFRYAGDEFLLLLPNTGTEEAAVVADRIRQMMQDQEIGAGLSGTVSVGVATMPLHALEGESLLAAADRAMYESKRAGKNRVTVASAN